MFPPGGLGFRVFYLRFCRIEVYLCYDRHFPEGTRVMGLAARRFYSTHPQ